MKWPWLMQGGIVERQEPWPAPPESMPLALPPDAAVVPARSWQPIETAPKDGRFLDLWVPSLGRIPNAFWAKEGDWMCSGWSFIGFTGKVELYIDPTHWMPLAPGPGITEMVEREPK